MSITTEELRAAYLRSGNVYAGSEKLGRIGQIYLDDETSEPTWVTVKTGLFGTSESFVPLNSARLEGDDILVDYDKDTIKNAPRIDADGDLTRARNSRFSVTTAGRAPPRRPIGMTKPIAMMIGWIETMTCVIETTYVIETPLKITNE
jgi:hypothetical protein